MLNITTEACTGCEMCKEICPVNAIEFVINNGFRFPVVNKDKCINCDLCNKRCPAITDRVEKNDFLKVYAGWTKNDNQRETCTSGGICYELSKYILENGGMVAGVAWCDGYKNAEYILVDNISKLSLITQTKYFQPEMRGIYPKIKAELDKGVKILFIGTACTNAGLKSYLNKEYDNLICCDFICRGYTSQLYHSKRVDELEKKFNSKARGVYYKNKSRGWEQFGTKFDFENGRSYYINRYDDPYEYMLQIDDYLTRISCFNCKYRDSHRISDITVGDFWGIKNISVEERNKGISAIMINTHKGQKLIKDIENNVCLQERSLWEISKGNHCLVGQLPYNLGRENFYADLEKETIENIHKKYGNIRKYKLEKRVLKLKKVLYLLKNINFMKFMYYNFFCNAIERERKAYIFPYRGSKLNIEKNARLTLHSSLHINMYKHKGSSEQTYLHIYPGAKFEVEGVVKIAAGSTIDVLSGAKLVMGQTNSNYNLVLICGNEIIFGDNVEIGRNVVVYDNNFHKTGLTQNVKGRPLKIGNHVWLCTGTTITKGLVIGDGAICGINSTVIKNVKERTMVLGNPAKKTLEDVEW